MGRKRLLTGLALVCSGFMLTAIAHADPLAVPDINRPFAAENWTLTDLNGQSYQPWANEQTRAVVLVFISPDCPVANYYQPTLRRIVDQFREAGQVEWFFVHALPQVTPEKARQHIQDYSINVPVLLDPQHSLALAAGARKMPQAAVVNRNGAIAYLGRIDDTYVGFGKRRAAATQHNLRDAIADVIAGKLVAQPRTDSVGCIIPFAATNSGRRSGGAP